MIMVSFAVFYEKMKGYNKWEEYNKLIPYINDNAIIEAQVIVECMNKSIEEQRKIESNEKGN